MKGPGRRRRTVPFDSPSLGGHRRVANAILVTTRWQPRRFVVCSSVRALATQREESAQSCLSGADKPLSSAPKTGTQMSKLNVIIETTKAIIWQMSFRRFILLFMHENWNEKGQ